MAPLLEVKTYVQVRAEIVLKVLEERIAAAQKRYFDAENHFFAVNKRDRDWLKQHQADLEVVFDFLIEDHLAWRLEQGKPRMNAARTVISLFHSPNSWLWLNLKLRYPELVYREIRADKFYDVGSVSISVFPESLPPVPVDESLVLRKYWEELPRTGIVQLELGSPLLEGVRYPPESIYSRIRVK